MNANAILAVLIAFLLLKGRKTEAAPPAPGPGPPGPAPGPGPTPAPAPVPDPSIPPIADFLIANLGGGLVRFTNRSTGAVVGSRWNFGDGTTSTEVSPVHQYSGFGTFVITLVVFNADGVINHKEKTLTLTQPTPTPTPTPTPPPEKRVVGITVVPSSVVVEVGNGTQLAAFATFSDGSSRSVTNEVAWISTNPAVASVTGTGVVSGRSAGSAVVSANLAGFGRGISVLVTAARGGL